MTATHGRFLPLTSPLSSDALALSSDTNTVSRCLMMVSFCDSRFEPASLVVVFTGYCRPRVSGGIHTVSRSTICTVSDTTVWLAIHTESETVWLWRRRQSLLPLVASRRIVQPLQMLSHRTTVSMRTTLNLPYCRL